MIDFLKGTVGKDYFSDRLYGCQECIAEYLASKEPLSQPTNQSFTNRFIESRIIWIGSTAGIFSIFAFTRNPDHIDNARRQKGKDAYTRRFLEAVIS